MKTSTAVSEIEASMAATLMSFAELAAANLEILAAVADAAASLAFVVAVLA
jgi:hypothetical protein